MPFLLPKKYLDLRPERIISHFVNLADQQKIVVLGKPLSETELKPTDVKRTVIQEICAYIASDRPMFRLHSADVGFGKTYVAAAGAGVVGYGCLVMHQPGKIIICKLNGKLTVKMPGA